MSKTKAVYAAMAAMAISSSLTRHSRHDLPQEARSFKATEKREQTKAARLQNIKRRRTARKTKRST